MEGRPNCFPLAALLWLFLWAASAAAQPATNTASSASSMFNVSAFNVEGRWLLPTNVTAPLLAKYAGTNVSMDKIIRAAADLEVEYIRQGYLTMNIIVAPRRFNHGVVTLNAFPGAMAQVVVGGYRYLVSSNGVETDVNKEYVPPSARPSVAQTAPLAAHATANAGPKFTVYNYEVTGNTLLPPKSISAILTNVPGAFGTNVSFDNIRDVVTHLQTAYRERGYVTVAVDLPPQRLTNATVKVQVIEGRLDAITVKGNRYFSSANVMRALPGLHTNMILNGLTFQAELNRANANQDRQIYPVIDPGPEPGTSDLTLDVKDRLPFHGKIDLDNESSPGTPDLRVNSSAVYDNLWQQDNSLGVQYGFSPEVYKDNDKWHFYDLPLVANYSTFYRLPLGNPESIEDAIANNPGSFGYDEATRKFNLPPASGNPELNFYASRSTIDTGIATLSSQSLYHTNGNSLTENIVQQDLTVNNDIGFRLSVPVSSSADFHSGFSAGLDFKTYELTSGKTNVFLLNGQEIDYVGNFTNAVNSVNNSPVPLTVNSLEYLPVSLHYDGGWRDVLGAASFGMGVSANAWLSGITTITHNPTNVVIYRDVSSLQQTTGSKKSSAYWVILTPSFSHTFEFVTNWVTTVRADGQWSSQPVISTEQFGAGGVNSVRGYHEGEVFGDNGWHVSLEQQTPPYVVGTVLGHTLLTVRGSVYMDFARVYLIDPQGRAASTPLWGIGMGGIASIGSHWQARLLLSLPMLSSPTIEAYAPYFNFSLNAQF
jgi:hemolysin activation/secretion protein